MWKIIKDMFNVFAIAAIVAATILIPITLIIGGLTALVVMWLKLFGVL